MRPRNPPPVHSALPLRPEGDGPDLCQRFCRRFGRPAANAARAPKGRTPARFPARMWLKDGPYFCVCFCTGFAQRKPVLIRRPRWRGSRAALRQSKETLQ